MLHPALEKWLAALRRGDVARCDAGSAQSLAQMRKADERSLQTRARLHRWAKRLVCPDCNGSEKRRVGLRYFCPHCLAVMVSPEKRGRSMHL